MAHEEQGRIKIARTRSQDGLTRKVFQSVREGARLDPVLLGNQPESCDSGSRVSAGSTTATSNDILAAF